jgi:RNA polymerase sigma-70 factor (ECF subfamily)
MRAMAEDLAGFCRREYPRLVGTLGLYCGDVDVAEELAQEALARACAQWRRVEGMAAPGAWVHRVAINLANSRFRRLAAQRRAEARTGNTDLSRGPDIADSVAIRTAVAALPVRQKTALVLRYYGDLPAEEVATHLGISVGAVHQLTHRALLALRNAFDVTEPARLAATMEAPDASRYPRPPRSGRPTPVEGARPRTDHPSRAAYPAAKDCVVGGRRRRRHPRDRRHVADAPTPRRQACRQAARHAHR